MLEIKLDKYHNFIKIDEDEEAASVRLREMRARRLAAEINRVNGLPVSSTATSTTSTVTSTPARTTATLVTTCTVTTTTTSSTITPTTMSVAGSPNKVLLDSVIELELFPNSHLSGIQTEDFSPQT